MSNEKYEEFDYTEFLDILTQLKGVHSIFGKIWEMGRPSYYLDDALSTAAVTFDKTGRFLSFILNKTFWESCNEQKKLFVFAHEALHILCNHMLRGIKESDKRQANRAADCAINHMLVTQFGFDRQAIDPENVYCWVDTLFPGQQIRTDQSFEYYLNLLKKNNNSPHRIQTVDDHDFKCDDDIISDFVSDLNGILTPEEKDKIKDFLRANNNDSNQIEFVDIKPVSKKRKWESVIMEWAAANIKEEFVSNEQWLVRPRRIDQIYSSDYMIPADFELLDIIREKNKTAVWFFQDTSGSCKHLADRFFTAARTLPEDRFDIRMFCFDTKVYETSLASGKLYGFGGT